MKMYEALANVAISLNNPSLAASALDYQTQRLDQLVKLLPSGSGFDAGTEFLNVISGDKRLHFKTAFHHMDDAGGYVEWSEHEVIVTPTLSTPGFDIRVTITGKNRSRRAKEIKEHIADVFYDALKDEAPKYPLKDVG